MPEGQDTTGGIGDRGTRIWIKAEPEELDSISDPFESRYLFSMQITGCFKG